MLLSQNEQFGLFLALNSRTKFSVPPFVFIVLRGTNSMPLADHVTKRNRGSRDENASYAESLWVCVTQSSSPVQEPIDLGA